MPDQTLTTKASYRRSDHLRVHHVQAGWRAGLLLRPGAMLAAATAHAAAGTEVEVRPIRCLANCTRGPSAAMRSNGSWTYVFGGLDVSCAAALIEGARMLARAADGILPWRGRPAPLKRGLIARIPPIDFKRSTYERFAGARPLHHRHRFSRRRQDDAHPPRAGNAQGRRLAVIVNEFGDVGIDGEILKGCGNAACPEENIVELANGCLCCTVADEFVPALDAILARDGVEHIVIETSGLALPKPLVQAFHWPAIKSRVTVDGVVVVVDGAALAAGRVAHDLNALARQRVADTALAHDDPIEEVFEDQIACADLVVLNKRDLIDAAGIEKAQAAISSVLPRSVKVIAVADGKVDEALLLGLGVGTEDDIANRRTRHDAEGSTTTTISILSSCRSARSRSRPSSPRASPGWRRILMFCASKVLPRWPTSRCGCWCRRSDRG